MKIFIDRCEQYPSYYVDDDPPDNIKKFMVDVDDEVLSRWNKIFSEYDSMQLEMEEYFNKQFRTK